MEQSIKLIIPTEQIQSLLACFLYLVHPQNWACMAKLVLWGFWGTKEEGEGETENKLRSQGGNRGDIFQGELKREVME